MTPEQISREATNRLIAFNTFNLGKLYEATQDAQEYVEILSQLQLVTTQPDLGPQMFLETMLTRASSLTDLRPRSMFHPIIKNPRDKETSVTTLFYNITNPKDPRNGIIFNTFENDPVNIWQQLVLDSENDSLPVAPILQKKDGSLAIFPHPKTVLVA